MDLTPEKKWAIKQMLFAEVLKELERHFTKLGVEWMPIKGAYLIMAGLAEKIPAREMVDVDILVREKDFVKVHSYFASQPGLHYAQGSWPVDRGAYDYESAIEGKWGSTHCTVDLHRSLGYPHQFNVTTDFIFSQSIRTGEYCRLPKPETATAIVLYQQIVNIAHHANPTLRADFTVITSQSDFSTGRFREFALQTHDATALEFIINMFLPDLNYLAGTGRGKQYKYLQFIANRIVIKQLYRTPKILRRFFIELPVSVMPVTLLVLGLVRVVLSIVSKLPFSDNTVRIRQS